METNLKSGNAIPLGDRNGVAPPAVEQEYRDAVEQLHNFSTGTCGKPLSRPEMLRAKNQMEKLTEKLGPLYDKLLDAGYTRSDILSIYKGAKENLRQD